MQKFIEKLKAFNQNHRKLAPFIIYIEVVLIFIASIFKNIFKNFKIVIAVLAVLIIVVFAVNRLNIGTKDNEVAQVVTESSSSDLAGEAVQDVSAGVASTMENILATEEISNVVDSARAEQDSSVEADSLEVTEDVSTAASSSEEIADSGSEVDSTMDEDSDLASFISEYPETVGWLQFEDERLSYPIMQADDNAKYALKDYQGNESNTGSIFIDYRSAADFSDSNTIIYGHNMRDRTMFGALKIYKEDLDFLEDHKYFRIITPNGTSRYMIFAFMDVPKDSYIYDVCGDNNARMREFLDTIEYKTYIDTGIEPTVDDKIITLSSCTQSDQLFFVMFAVKVE